MSEKLKPCPFCGGEPGMVQQTKVNWAVMCHVCGAEGGWSNPSDAIALWNRRPTPPQAVPALTDWQIEEAVIEACHSDPRSITPGEYCLSLDEIRNVIDLLAAQQPSPEPKEPEHAHDWRFSLQDHVYKCDCGATRGDYPFGAASFKD